MTIIHNVLGDALDGSCVSRACRFRVTGGFTLIEVLVVSGILCVLMAMLVPVSRSVWNNAYRAKCAAHMRQFGGGIFAYANEWNGRLPSALQICGSAVGLNGFLGIAPDDTNVQRILGLQRTNEVSYCPAVRDIAEGEITAGSSNNGRTVDSILTRTGFDVQGNSTGSEIIYNYIANRNLMYDWSDPSSVTRAGTVGSSTSLSSQQVTRIKDMNAGRFGLLFCGGVRFHAAGVDGWTASPSEEAYPLFPHVAKRTYSTLTTSSSNKYVGLIAGLNNTLFGDGRVQAMRLSAAYSQTTTSISWDPDREIPRYRVTAIGPAQDAWANFWCAAR